MTAAVEVFDPSMCCSTGICGPSVDPVLPRFAADLEWLAEHGIRVTRHNLAQEPAAFAAAPAVQAALSERGTDCLPLILIDGRIVSQGAYPTRAELAGWAGLDGEPAPTLYSESVAELIAIGAAIAANCEPCFKYHYDKARTRGVSVGATLSTQPTAILAVPRLYALKHRPEAAAREYRERVVGPYRGVLPQAAVASIDEQLSGACTVEIAAFDEFSKLLGNPATTTGFDHVV